MKARVVHIDFDQGLPLRAAAALKASQQSIQQQLFTRRTTAQSFHSHTVSRNQPRMLKTEAGFYRPEVRHSRRRYSVQIRSDKKLSLPPDSRSLTSLVLWESGYSFLGENKRNKAKPSAAQALFRTIQNHNGKLLSQMYTLGDDHQQSNWGQQAPGRQPKASRGEALRRREKQEGKTAKLTPWLVKAQAQKQNVIHGRLREGCRDFHPWETAGEFQDSVM